MTKTEFFIYQISGQDHRLNRTMQCHSCINIFFVLLSYKGKSYLLKIIKFWASENLELEFLAGRNLDYEYKYK